MMATIGTAQLFMACQPPYLMIHGTERSPEKAIVKAYKQIQGLSKCRVQNAKSMAVTQSSETFFDDCRISTCSVRQRITAV